MLSLITILLTVLGSLGAFDASAQTQANQIHGNGANCSAGDAPLGVDELGAVEGCWTPSSGSAHIIEDETTPLAAQPDLNFEGAGVSCVDDAGNTATVCTISGSAHGNGANCAAGEIALGVDAAGAAEGCYQPAEADITDLTHTTDTSCTLGVCTVGIDDTITLEGGTTVTGIVDDEVFVGSGAGAGAFGLLPNCVAGNVLTYTQATNAFGCEADAGGTETNTLTTVTTGITTGQIPIGTTAGGTVAYVTFPACAVDEKPEYVDGAPDTIICEAISGLVDADVSDTLTSSIFVGSGSLTNAVDLATAEASGTLSVPNGGTGNASVFKGSLLYGNGTGPLVYSTIMTEGQLIIGDGVEYPDIVAMSGDATLASSGLLTITDDSHAHTTTTVSGLNEADITDLAHTATAITDGLIVEADLDADEVAVDNDILTFDTTGSNFSWQTPAELSLSTGAHTTDTGPTIDCTGTELQDASGTCVTTLTELNTSLSTGLVTGAHTTETNDLESVATSAADAEVFVGTGAGAGAYITGLAACAADEKIEYVPGVPDTFTCEAIGSLSEGDITDLTHTTDTSCTLGVCSVGTDDDIILEEQGAADPTVDGNVEWDTTTETLKIGDDGVATLEFFPLAHFVPNTDPGVDHASYVAGHGDGADCSAGSYPLGVTAAGAVTSCTDASTETDSIVATHTAIAGAHHTATVETNDLESAATNVADTEIFVGTGAGTGAYVVMSSDATLANTGAITLAANSVDSAEITAGAVDEDHLAASLVFDDGDLLDFGSNVTSATEGIMLPAHATDCSTATAEGQICWEEDAKNLWVGDGAAAVQMNAAAPATEVRSMYWGAGSLSADATNCANAAEVTINSGPKLWSIICTDNDASIINGTTVMPDGWDAGTLTFSLNYIQTAADTSALNADVKAQCRNATTTVNSTYGTEVAIDDAAVTGSNAIDQTTSAAVTANGTCAAGDILFWQIALDATGTTTAVATLHLIGVKMEYTSDIGD